MRGRWDRPRKQFLQLKAHKKFSPKSGNKKNKRFEESESARTKVRQKNNVSRKSKLLTDQKKSTEASDLQLAFTGVEIGDGVRISE